MITLGIIGVVAAMTIPNLIATQQKKQTVTRLQKAISILNQAYRLSFEENGEPSVDESFQLGSVEYFKRYWQPYIKADICTTVASCGYSSRNGTIFSSGNGVPNGTALIMDGGRTTFYTPDGILYSIWTAGGSQDADGKPIRVPSKYVLVDLNGGKGPNNFGIDVFFLQRVTNDGGGIQPIGYDKSNKDVNNSCTSKGPLNPCAEKIKRAGWKIEKDYPWSW